MMKLKNVVISSIDDTPLLDIITEKLGKFLGCVEL